MVKIKKSKNTHEKPLELERKTQATSIRQDDSIHEGAEVVPWWDAEESAGNPNSRKETETLKRILEGSWKLMSEEAKEGYVALVKRRRCQPFEKTTKVKIPTKSTSKDGCTVSEPHVVGGTAPKLTEDNMGSRMLRSMGWNPGEGLGRDRSGRTSPIEVVARPRLKGLGHGTS